MIKKIKKSNGQSIIELAITINILIVIFFSILGFGSFLYGKIMLLSAVNRGIEAGISVASNINPQQIEIESAIKQSLDSNKKDGLFLGAYLGESIVAAVSNDQVDISISMDREFNFPIPFIGDLPNISADANAKIKVRQPDLSTQYLN